VAAVGPVDHCDAALRIARSRWRSYVDAEDRAAESAAMSYLDRLLDQRLVSMAHARQQMECCS
jgi:hypothetical protein